MWPGTSPRSRARTRAVVALALAWLPALALDPASPLPVLPAPSPAWAASVPRSGGALSPRLAELARPAVRSAPPAKQAKALSLAPAGPGSLLREGNRVLVEVHFDRGAAAGADDLRAAGAGVVNVSRSYQTVTVAARPGELKRISEVPRIAAATEVLTPITSASTCPSGAVVSEGDVQLRADEARSTFGVDGSGVTVGVLSDSFDRNGGAVTDASDDVTSGDLPGAANTCSGQSTPVDVLDDSSVAGADEGRGMAQIAHDLAPGAGLAFATAFSGETAFAENIETLAKSSGEGGAEAQVIVDDVTYFEEPFFQEGPVGVAASNVTGGGVSYFSSAANNNLIDAIGRDIASWEAPQYRDSGGCPVGLPPYAAQCVDFDPEAPVDSTLGLKVSNGATLRLDLQWAQPWNGVTTDLDAYLLNSADELVAQSEYFNVTLTQRPFEFLSWTNSTGTTQTVRVAVNRCDPACDGEGGDGASPRLKLALLQNGGGVTESEYPVSAGGDTVGPTIFGHNGGEDVTSVAAIRYDASTAPEPYSSRGPVTHHFGPVSGVTPAAPLGSPQVLSKPDLTATDCGVTTFFSFEVGGKWRFCGTSAAAPHAAAVAALLHDSNPSLTPTQVREAMADSAQPVGAFGPGAVGAGLVDAMGALAEVAEPVPPGEEPPGEEPEGEGSEPEGTEEGGGSTSTGGGAVVSTPGPSAAAAASPATGVADRVAPGTVLRQRPRKLVRTRHRGAKAVFRFGSNERGAAFLCRVDRGRFRGCKARFARRYPIGMHVVRVKARDRAGNVDRTPAVYRFRVKRLRKTSSPTARRQGPDADSVARKSAKSKVKIGSS